MARTKRRRAYFGFGYFGEGWNSILRKSGASEGSGLMLFANILPRLNVRAPDVDRKNRESVWLGRVLINAQMFGLGG
jgi:hypothetical protein